MTVLNILMAAAGSSGTAKTYVDDVFSAYTYTGNGSTQTITNGIDLAGKGGLVWIKGRTNTENHALFDTTRGTNKYLSSNTTSAQNTGYTDLVTSYNANGFTLGADASTVGLVNNSPIPYVSWTFRKQPKFFDVVTYTGTGTTQNITHSLGINPGMIIYKATSTTSDWIVTHRTNDGSALKLNTTDIYASLGVGGISSNASSFSVGGLPNLTNISGVQYVAYLFAHDTNTDGWVQCGSFTTDTSGNATVNLGWEPQFLMVKRVDSPADWRILDISCSFSQTATTVLIPNSSGAESNISNGNTKPIATGFSTSADFGASSTNIYMAIRRPNKPPTTGTQVYKSLTRTGTGAAAVITGVGFAPDMAISQERGSVIGFEPKISDRLRGASQSLTPSSAVAEDAPNQISSFNMDGISLVGPSNNWNYSGETFVQHYFKRALGFFDEVCYTQGVNTQNHNLGIVPELAIRKQRNSASEWDVRLPAILGGGDKLELNNNAAKVTSNFLTVTNTTFNYNFHAGAGTYVVYLFASLSGISKVGIYTGNGTTQTINCGFAAGARFVLIKRTDAAGDWYVWDTVRGIVTANDPHLSLNTTAAEVTTDDSIDPDSTGFIVNQVAATNINVTSGTYIFLAIA